MLLATTVLLVRVLGEGLVLPAPGCFGAGRCSVVVSLPPSPLCPLSPPLLSPPSGPKI